MVTEKKKLTYTVGNLNVDKCHKGWMLKYTEESSFKTMP